MPKNPILNADARVADLLAACTFDPARFVRTAFGWGEGDLADHPGPDPWQQTILDTIGTKLVKGERVIRIAVASGHGIGKSALVAWLALWALSTREGCKGMITANTDNQLRTKTWPELAKWHGHSVFRPWFNHSATALCSNDPDFERLWRIDAVPWSKSNPAAFAGLHNQGGRLLLVFDEASEIDDRIWEVAEGALTDKDTEIIWLAFGNPTRNTGRFRECFGRFRHRWTHAQIDSRTVRMTNKTLLEQWVEDYGEDSDFVRVRVKGLFPRAGSMQLIGTDLIELAIGGNAEASPFDPLVMGIDVARFGDDQSVIVLRRGRDAKSGTIERHRGLDTMALAARAAALIGQFRPR